MARYVQGEVGELPTAVSDRLLALRAGRHPARLCRLPAAGRHACILRATSDRLLLPPSPGDRTAARPVRDAASAPRLDRRRGPWCWPRLCCHDARRRGLCSEYEGLRMRSLMKTSSALLANYTGALFGL